MGCAAPLQHSKFIYLYTFRPKKGLKFDFFNLPIVAFSYAKRRYLLASPKSYTYKFKLLNYAFYLTKYQFLYTRGAALDPCQWFVPRPHRGPISGPAPQACVLALCARYFSLQAIPKSWKP